MGGHEPVLGPEERTQVGGLDPQLGGQCLKLRPPGESQVPGTTLVVTTFAKDVLLGVLSPAVHSLTKSPTGQILQPCPFYRRHTGEERPEATS